VVADIGKQRNGVVQAKQSVNAMFPNRISQKLLHVGQEVYS
jgi:hypothetical protein